MAEVRYEDQDAGKDRRRRRESTARDAESVSQLLHAPWEHGVSAASTQGSPAQSNREGKESPEHHVAGIRGDSVHVGDSAPSQAEGFLCYTPAWEARRSLCVGGRGHAAKLGRAEGQIGEPRHEWGGPCFCGRALGRELEGAGPCPPPTQQRKLPVLLHPEAKGERPWVESEPVWLGLMAGGLGIWPDRSLGGGPAQVGAWGEREGSHRERVECQVWLIFFFF